MSLTTNKMLVFAFVLTSCTSNEDALPEPIPGPAGLQGERGPEGPKGEAGGTGPGVGVVWSTQSGKEIGRTAGPRDPLFVADDGIFWEVDKYYGKLQAQPLVRIYPPFVGAALMYEMVECAGEAFLYAHSLLYNMAIEHPFAEAESMRYLTIRGSQVQHVGMRSYKDADGCHLAWDNVPGVPVADSEVFAPDIGIEYSYELPIEPAPAR